MDESSLSIGGELSQELQSRFGAPAYIRRARQVEDAFSALVQQCRVWRAQQLEMVRTRLGLLYVLAGEWDAVRPLVADEEQIETLRRLYAEMEPRLRTREGPTASARALRQAFNELRESIRRFNRRWREFLGELDLRRINVLRDGYNRYYVLEKECALRSPRLARQGFRPLEPVAPQDLEALLPPLPEPRVPGTA